MTWMTIYDWDRASLSVNAAVTFQIKYTSSPATTILETCKFFPQLL